MGELIEVQKEEVEERQFGIKIRMIPLLAFLVGSGSVLGSYWVARSHTPPNVSPFPWTDITHCGIKFPEYTILRIGLLACAPLFALCFYALTNFLQDKSFEITGGPASLSSNKWLPIVACLLLGLSTSTISDGGDMNWTLHTIGATGFFIIAMYLILGTSRVYRELYVKRPFISPTSYAIKKYTNLIAIALIALAVGPSKMVGSLGEWAATFYLLFYFLTLYWDFKDYELVLVRK